MHISRVTSFCLSFPILFCLACNAAGQQIAIDLDPAQTVINFVLGDVLHTVHGTFRLRTGRISINPAAQSIAGAIAVDATSGDSGNGTRDKRMKRDILQADRYPEITFTPEKISSVQPIDQTSDATVSGWFTIHGGRHEISLPVHIRMSASSVRANTRFVVPYVEWGMKNPSTLFLRVNDKVDVNVTAVGRIEEPRRPK